MKFVKLYQPRPLDNENKNILTNCTIIMPGGMFTHRFKV